MNELDFSLAAFLQSEAIGFVLRSARIAGTLAVAPLPWMHAPVRIRALLILALGVVVHSSSPLPVDVTLDTPLIVAMSTTSEFLLGAAIGFVLRLMVAVAEIAASAISISMGLGAAEIFMPGAGSENLLARFVRLFALLGALLVGLHRELIGALLASFTAIPAGSIPNLPASGPALLELTSLAIETGVRLALPVLAVLFVLQLALAFVSRAAPAMQIFSIGFAVTIVAGAATLLVTLPDLGQDLLRDASQVPERIEHLLQTLVW